MKKLYALAGLILICCAAGHGQTPRKAPINPEYLRYLELVEKGLWERTTKEGYTLGYVPSPIGFITSDTGPKEIKDLPSSFDLRNHHGQNYLTEVKHQGSCGSCWAFSTLAAIESRLLMLGEGHYNLSENHMKQHHGFAHGPCDGGNHYLSTAYLSRGSGSILEADAPYHAYDHCSHNGNPPVMYQTQAVFLPNNSDVIKQAIMDYGALYTVMRYEGQAYRAADYTYYYSGSDDPNHAINLVGWDDNKQTAGGSGAWIVRNSWGANWGESGYFYIAYQDARVNASVAYWPEKIDFSSNTVINYSDHLGATSGIGYGTNTGYALIKLIADKDHELLNLGTYVMASGATVGFEVYGHFSNGSLSNLLGSIPNHHIDHAGYVTLELPTPIDVSTGQTFYVKVYYRTPGYNWPIPVEAEWSDYSYPTIEQGVSWISSNGTSWTALGQGTDWLYNLCVKAHGLAPEDDDPGLSIITFNVRDQHAQAVADARITITTGGSKTMSAMPHTENAQGVARAAPQGVVQAAPQGVVQAAPQGSGGLDRAWVKDSDGVWLKAVSANEALDLDIGVFPVIAETEPIILYTDAGGQASFQATDGPYAYTVEKAGHHPAGGEFAVSEDDVNIDVTLEQIMEYTLTYHAGDHGHISGETTQTVPHGGSGSQVEAVPDAGYHFVEWCDGLQTAKRTDTEVSGDINTTASFAINKYIIEASANNEQLGSVSGGGEYEHGATATLLATSLDASNYIFVNWTEEGAQVHAAAEYVFEVTSNRSLVAHFQNVTATQPPEGLSAIRVFPIPARHILVVESAVPLEEVRLFDMVGRRHYAASVHALSYEINVADLETGSYFLQLTTEQGLSTFQVLVAD